MWRWLGVIDAILILVAGAAVVLLIFQYTGWPGIGVGIGALLVIGALKAACDSEPDLMSGAVGCLVIAGVIIAAGALFAFGINLIG